MGFPVILEATYQRCLLNLFVLSRVTTYGEEIYNYTIFAGNNIVSVYIDEDVDVQPGSGPRDMHVTFTMHHSPASVHGLVCNLTYISQWGDTNMVSVLVNQISLDANVTFNNLIPYTLYTFNITCRPTASTYWSNLVTGRGRTLSTVPDSTPGLIGYSTQMTSQNLTQIYLYFRPVPVYTWYAEELRYVVTMDDNDVVVVDIFDGHTITAELLHQVPANKTYTVIVHSENEAGESKMAEGLNLVATEIDGTSVVVEESAIGAVVTLYPTGSGNTITGVTFFRCQGQPDLYPPFCTKELHNQTVSGFMHTFFWPQYLTNISVYTWYYGVTIHRQAAYDDRYIEWSNCVFRENKIARDTTLDVSAMYDAVNSSVVIVTLHFDYCSLRQRPAEYLVGVWNSATNITDYCSLQHSEFQRFTASPSTYRLNVAVSDVTNPLLCLRVQYQNDYDMSGEIVPQYSSRLQQSAIGPSVTTLTSTDIAIAVIGSIIASLVLAILVMVIRRFRHRLLKHNKLPLRVMKSMLESAPQVLENIPHYTLDGGPINSSGYESHQVTSSEPVQNLSTCVMFTNLYYTDHKLTEPAANASNSGGSISEPIVNYTQVRHREDTVDMLSGMEDELGDTLDTIEINQNVSKNSDSGTGNMLILNYAHIQAGDADKDESDDNSDGGEVDSRDKVNNIEIDQDVFGNSDSCAGNTLNLKYAHLQAVNTDNDDIDVDYMEVSNNNCAFDGVGYAHSRKNDEDDDNTPVLNYIQVGSACSVDTCSGDTGVEAEEEPHGFDNECTSLANPHLSEDVESVVHDAGDHISTTITGISEGNNGECPSGSVPVASTSSEISDTDDDNDVIDSYSQFTSPNEISSGYALASIVNNTSF